MLQIACRRSPVWDPETSPDEIAAGKSIVLFAAMDPGPLREHYPRAGMDYAKDMTGYINAFVNDAEARLGRFIPPSSSPEWEAGPVGSARGAHFIVLSRVRDISVEDRMGTTGRPQRIFASVEMVARDANGEIAWQKVLTGSADNERSPKMMAPSSKPESRAVWAAVREGLKGFRVFLSGVSALQSYPDVPAPDIVPRQLIDIRIESAPQNASIYVDGRFRGTTPMTVPLPVRELTLRLRRQGYQVWETKLIPSTDMEKVQPALEPLPGYEAEPEKLPGVEDDGGEPEPESGSGGEEGSVVPESGSGDLKLPTLEEDEPDEDD